MGIIQLLCTCKLPLVARKSPTFPLQTHTLFLITVLTLLLILFLHHAVACPWNMLSRNGSTGRGMPPAARRQICWVQHTVHLPNHPNLIVGYHGWPHILATSLVWLLSSDGCNLGGLGILGLVSIDKSLLLWWVACPYERQHPSASYLTSNSSGLLLISSSLVLSFAGNSQLAGTICA